MKLDAANPLHKWVYLGDPLNIKVKDMNVDVTDSVISVTTENGVPLPFKTVSIEISDMDMKAEALADEMQKARSAIYPKVADEMLDGSEYQGCRPAENYAPLPELESYGDGGMVQFFSPEPLPLIEVREISEAEQLLRDAMIRIETSVQCVTKLGAHAHAREALRAIDRVIHLLWNDQ